MRLRTIGALVLLFLCARLSAQYREATPVVDAGFASNDEVRLNFSPRKSYVYATCYSGELGLWELRTGRRVLHLQPTVAYGKIEFAYEPCVAFSQDERFMLVPDYGNGAYLLYDLVGNSVMARLEPRFAADGELFTAAAFSDDGKHFLLVALKAGDPEHCRLVTFNAYGGLERSVLVELPQPLESEPDLAQKVSWLLEKLGNKDLRALRFVSNILSIATSPDLGEVWFNTLSRNIFRAVIRDSVMNSMIYKEQLQRFETLDNRPLLHRISLDRGRIVALGEKKMEKQSDGANLFRDSIFLFNARTGKLEGRKVAQVYARPVYNNVLPVSIGATNAALSCYADLLPGKDMRRHFVYRDMQTDAVLFEYGCRSAGKRTRLPLMPGSTGGGIVVAVSPDGSLMLEMGPEVIVHQTRKKAIQQHFTIASGLVKLAPPLFLDSTHLFFPKVYRDGFTLNMRDGTVARLRRSLDCMDTVYGGDLNTSVQDQSILRRMNNASWQPQTGLLAIANYSIDSGCQRDGRKTIDVWELASGKKVDSITVFDTVFTHYLAQVPGHRRLFLINGSLLDASGSQPVWHPLQIVQKKDTFLAMKPVYFPSSNSIFTALATCTKKGNPDLYFAYFDLQGKLLRSYRLDRRNARLDEIDYLTESILSPDSSLLFYSFFDGTGGTFQIAAMKPGIELEHGTRVWEKANLKRHTMITGACFVDGQHVVTSGNDLRLLLWDLRKPKEPAWINRKKGYYFTGITCSPDGKLLVGRSVAGTVDFVRVADGEQVLSFVAPASDAYLMLTPAGAYVSNKKTVPGLSFFSQGKGYDNTAFDIQLNRPDLVLAALGYSSPETISRYYAAYRKRLQLLGKGAPATKQKLPLVWLEDLPDDMAHTTASEIRFTVKAKADVTLKTLHISVNGVPIYGAQGKPLAFTGGLVNAVVNVPLSQGQNVVRISVAGEGAESLPETIVVQKVPTGAKPDLYLVAIGSGDFREPGHQLPLASKDARDIVSMFQGHAQQYGSVYVDTLINSLVTASAIGNLRVKLQRSKPDDVVVFFFAGHGLRDLKRRLFLSTFDTHFGMPEQGSIPYELVEQLIDVTGSRHRIVFIDACNSGELDESSADRYVSAKKQFVQTPGTRGDGNQLSANKKDWDEAFGMMQTQFSDLRHNTGATVLVAAGAIQSAAESSQLKNGVFTYALKAGLGERKADIDADGQILMSELLEYLRKTVAGLSNGTQLPGSRSENLIEDIRVW